MVGTREIKKTIGVWLVRITIHADAKIAHVDAVFAHIEEDKDIGRAEVGTELRKFLEDLPFSGGIELGVHFPTVTTEPKVHGHGANAVKSFPIHGDSGF